MDDPILDFVIRTEAEAMALFGRPHPSSKKARIEFRQALLTLVSPPVLAPMAFAKRMEALENGIPN